MEKRLNGLVSKAIKNNGVINESEVEKIFKEEELDAVYTALEEAGIDVIVDEAEDAAAMSWDESKAPVTDGVKLYMREIGRIPLLSAEQEAEIGERIMKGDESAKNELVEHNLRLVISVARKYIGNAGMTFMDLVQEGNIGLMKAADKFDPSKGYKFSTYATWWIRQTIGRAVQEQSRTIRIPVHMVETAAKMNKAIRKLTQELEREPSIEEIASEMKVPADKIKFLFEANRDPLSLDNRVNDEDDATVGDLVADHSAEVPGANIIKEENKQMVMNVLGTLSDREKEVMVLRFGLEDDKPRTLEEIGQHFGVTRERIRQIETKALRKLRNPVRSKMLHECLA